MVSIAICYAGRVQVDSAFYPPWDGKLSTSQRAVVLCGWGVKAGRQAGRHAAAAATTTTITTTSRKHNDLVSVRRHTHRDSPRPACDATSVHFCPTINRINIAYLLDWEFIIRPRPSTVVLGGATGRALDLRSTGRGFKSYSGQSCITTLGKLFTPMCLTPSTKQYNLVPAKGRWCSAAGKVTAVLVKINDNLPPGWLPVHRDQLWAQCSVKSMGTIYLLLLYYVCRWQYSFWLYRDVLCGRPDPT